MLKKNYFFFRNAFTQAFTPDEVKTIYKEAVVPHGLGSELLHFTRVMLG